MQEGRLACARGRHQRDRLTGPHRKLDVLEDFQRGFALDIAPHDALQKDERCVIRRRRITHNEAPRPDRGAPPARTDTALQAATTSAPSPAPRSCRVRPFRPEALKENKAQARTIQWRSATTGIAGS